MAADNVYDEDQEYLIEARDTISELEDLKDKLEEIKLLQKKNKRAIVREERATGDEISATLKKRKEQIAASYDRQIDVNNSKIRQVQTKKDKKKSQRMEDRINKETADIREENRQLNAAIKTLFKKNHVPAFCNTKMYYCLFSPKGMSEFLPFGCMRRNSGGSDCDFNEYKVQDRKPYCNVRADCSTDHNY